MKMHNSSNMIYLDYLSLNIIICIFFFNKMNKLAISWVYIDIELIPQRTYSLLLHELKFELTYSVKL